jgi:hypothetical protein
MDVRKAGCCGIDWNDLAQDWNEWRAFVNTYNVGELLEKMSNWWLPKKDSAAWS